MKFVFKSVNTLPKLAWCAVIEREKESVEILHGPWVEFRERFFVEGVWDGSFADGDFNESTSFMGSGGKISNGKVTFVAPCHTIERLIWVRRDNFLFVSNSLTFALKKSGLRLDIDYIPYISDFASISRGIKKYTRNIPTLDGVNLNLVYYRNIEVDKNLNVHEIDKNSPPEFTDFGSYNYYLVSSLKKLAKNANDDLRSINYTPITTVSKGYDSVACSALGREIGCSKAITISGPGKYIVDCGTKLAEVLGYKDIKEYNADSYKLKIDEFPEAEFFASGELGTDCFWSAFEDELPGTMVLTGIHGDKVWDVNNKHVTRDIVRSLPAATSICEYRLRVGFIQVPIPFLGCVSHKSIRKISNSEEMRPWRTNNDYDRPIPRRIVEEKGVARNLFGFVKVGAGFNVQWYPKILMKKIMNPNSYQAFFKFYKENKGKRSFRQYFIHHIIYRLFFISLSLNYFLSKIKCRWRLPKINIPDKYTSNPDAPSFLLHWGLQVIDDRYST
ncbi:hypothetical protein ACFL02_06055 [Planctomycetota bacterium]